MGIKKKHVPGCGCCGGTPPETTCGGCASSYAINNLTVEISGLTEDDVCCDDVNAVWNAFATGDECVFSTSGAFGTVCGGGFAFGNYSITGTFAADGSNVKLTVVFTITRGSPFFDTPLSITFEGSWAAPFDCDSLLDEPLTVTSYTNSAAMTCTQGSLAATVTAN